MSARLYACISVAPTDGIYLSFNIGDFHERLSRKSYFFLSRSQMSGTLHEDCLRFIVAGDIESSLERSFRVIWCQAFGVGEEV
jgi:hypothetical protein